MLDGDSVVGKNNSRFKSKNKSTSGGTISSYFLKLALLLVQTTLAIMFNTSIEIIKFPNFWKLAGFTLIFKGVTIGQKDQATVLYLY